MLRCSRLYTSCIIVDQSTSCGALVAKWAACSYGNSRAINCKSACNPNNEFCLVHAYCSLQHPCPRGLFAPSLVYEGRGRFCILSGKRIRVTPSVCFLWASPYVAIHPIPSYSNSHKAHPTNHAMQLSPESPLRGAAWLSRLRSGTC